MPVHPDFLASLKPVLDVVTTLSPLDVDAADKLHKLLPLSSAPMKQLREVMRRGVTEGWLCDRENAGVKYSRVQKAGDGGWSVDAVHMATAALGHTHPKGEIDLCFSVDGHARFDGNLEGWVVYGANTWHVPTVESGAMDILYFLPGGAIAFGEKPEGATQVGK